MKELWILLFLVLPAVFGQAGFGQSYLRNSRLCHQWNCINTKLGLPDSLPPRQQSEETLRRLLPTGPWQDVLGTVLDNCYGNRTKRYMNTCPGQALMHCIVDQMVNNCPEESWKKDDSCSPVTSLAGLKYMFSQSRYIDLEKNLPKEHRPTWFLKNYFDTKCCDLPVMFNKTVLEECGFSEVMTYYTHQPRYIDAHTVHFKNHASVPQATTPSNNGDTLKIVDFNQMPIENENTDPLDCCDMSQFIQPSWRSECDFHLSWAGQERLVIGNQTAAATEAPVTTTTERADQVKDLMLVPESCEKETCVFRKLGIIGESGALDIDAYMRLLHNFTDAHPTWSKAKARVITKCLVKPVTRSYEAECEINKVLSCTFDVLTENCPYTRKSDICKHGKQEVSCQISSSKYRPKNRREICVLPELVHHDHLSECGLPSLYLAEHVPVPPKQRKTSWLTSYYACKDSKIPTTCLMDKMGILTKYKFMDYFKMKDRIRQFTKDQSEWSALLEVYMSAFMNIPMYPDHCNSQKKLLNVVDAMLMTCPISKRKNTPQCNKIFTEMTHTAPVDKQNVTREKLDEILKHYHHVFMPTQPLPTTFDRVIQKKHSKTVKKPIFSYGLLNSKDAPTVEVINVKPISTPNRPLILKPVYLSANFGRRPLVNDGVFRSNSFWLHDQIAKAHTSASLPYTLRTTHNNLYTTRPLILPTVSTTASSITLAETDFPIEMLKPE